MDTLKAWKTITQSFNNEILEFPTVPIIKREPVWFSAYIEDDEIMINQALHHKPSSQLKYKRALNYKDFQKVLPLYYMRKNGEQVSKELTEATVNQVYFLSLIKHVYDIDEPNNIIE